MSYEPDLKNSVMVSVSFDPLPRRWFMEFNHALAQASRLSLILTKFFFFFSLCHVLTVSSVPPCIFMPPQNENNS